MNTAQKNKMLLQVDEGDQKVLAVELLETVSWLLGVEFDSPENF
jgi:hypothetical protein